MADLIQEAEFWVAVAFVVFVAGMLYMKVHKTAASALDTRAEQIKNELDEAQRLREEAQHALAEYKRMQRDAAKEAVEILRLAASEADTMRERARDDLAKSVQRRGQQAIARIAQAEAEATQQVRDMAIDIAISATGKVLGDELQGSTGKKIIDTAIADLPQHVN
jgi:F-type H+-transporting ATPase subunit b